MKSKTFCVFIKIGSEKQIQTLRLAYRVASVLYAKIFPIPIGPKPRRHGAHGENHKRKDGSSRELALSVRPGLQTEAALIRQLRIFTAETQTTAPPARVCGSQRKKEKKRIYRKKGLWPKVDRPGLQTEADLKRQSKNCTAEAQTTAPPARGVVERREYLGMRLARSHLRTVG